MERLDIYDANMRVCGTMDRDEAHRRGEWHRTVHLWLVDPREGGRLLFQLRGPDVRANPGKLDATAAGHILAGEDDLAALREVPEELGIEIPAPLHHLGYRCETADMPTGDRNREFQSVFMALATPGLRFAPDPGEVHGVLAIDIQAIFDLFDGSRREVTGAGIEYDRLADRWHDAERRVGLHDLVPRFERYYLNIAIMAERLLEGRMPLAIG
ncbi:NUDIX hydrolase [Sphingomonas sp. ERG5]|uniref:NUDIX hydrolase n=1 Tax=Sphingomonas sp. ERG5 TaxID=1381597 RepID=UPI00054BDCD1|nr:NUDIX domain-containing protein [Sphingomonas sp. ERG5]